MLQVRVSVKKANFDEQFELIHMTIRMGVEGAEELTDEDFEGFPMGALTKLSEDVMEVSGLGAVLQRETN